MVSCSLKKFGIPRRILINVFNTVWTYTSHAAPRLLTFEIHSPDLTIASNVGKNLFVLEDRLAADHATGVYEFHITHPE
jgi:hypothetical protein